MMPFRKAHIGGDSLRHIQWARRVRESSLVARVLCRMCVGWRDLKDIATCCDAYDRAHDTGVIDQVLGIGDHLPV